LAGDFDGEVAVGGDEGARDRKREREREGARAREGAREREREKRREREREHVLLVGGAPLEVV